MEKIDMVYLWCDGNDIEFKKRRAYFQKKIGNNDDTEVTGDKRFFNNDELKYSLRSLEIYAPWVNHVFIITDRQKPEWLNTKYEKVTIVDHSEIMPEEIIPCFNSDVLEYFLGFIPNLSEYFLYGNDDMFFGRDVSIEDFFCNGKAIVKLKCINCSKFNEPLNNFKYSYLGTVIKTNKLINESYGKEFMYQTHHNIDAYIKSSYLATFYKFEKELTKYIYNRFRDKEDLQRTLFTLDMVCNDKGIVKIVSDPPIWKRHLSLFFKNIWESYVDDDSLKARREILKYKPMLFCLNASDDFDSNKLESMKVFLEKLFPYKSKFEK